MGPKIFWVQKIVGPKNLSLKNILSQSVLVLPYGIGLSKVGWIGRWGVEMWVPFLGSRVAFIPNPLKTKVRFKPPPLPGEKG